MTFEEITDFLTPAERARLKLNDSRPTLALYRVAHEGVSSGSVMGLGRLPKRWSRARVEELARSMAGNSVPVYRGHPNGWLARTPIGRILKSFSREHEGTMETLAVVHLTEPKAAEEAIMNKLDAASIEADLSLEPTGEGWEVAQVERVTGLALAPRDGHRPGFPNAGLIAAVRENDTAPTPVEDPATAPPEDNHTPPTPDLHGTIEQALAGKNLSRGEWEFIHRRVRARVGENTDQERIGREVELTLADLEETKRLYRPPPTPIQAPAERRKGPMDYTNPEHNELIPK